MDSFTLKLVSKATGQLFSDILFNCLINFFPEQLKVEVQWQVAVLEAFYASTYQNVTKRNSGF